MTGIPLDGVPTGRRPSVPLLIASLVALAASIVCAMPCGDSGGDAVPTIEAQGTCGAQGDNLSWTFYSDGTLMIDGTGKMKDFYGGDLHTKWGGNAFRIKEVIIGDSVESIGSCAFHYCNSIVRATIGESVRSIGQSAFYTSSALQEIRIPASVTSMRDSVFTECYALRSITVDESNPSFRSVDGILFNSSMTELIRFPCSKVVPSYTIPASVTTLQRAAFQGCFGLGDSLTVPDTVTSMGDQVFRNCSRLKTVILPDNFDTIEYATFQGAGLTSFTIPASVKTLGDRAFASCFDLESITIPDTVEAIAPSTFSSCSELHEIRFGWGLKSVEGHHTDYFDPVFYAEDGVTPLEWEAENFRGYIFTGTLKKMVRTGIVPRMYSVEFDTAGGSGDAPETMEVMGGGSFTVPSYSGALYGYGFGGWSYGGATYMPGETFSMGHSDIVMTAVWDPMVMFDHTELTDIVGTDAGGVSLLPSAMAIAEGSAYPRLLDTAGYRHIGWRIGDGFVEPNAGLVRTDAHTAVSVWEAIPQDGGFIPTPEDGGWDDAPFIPAGNGGSGEGRSEDAKGLLVIAIAAAVIAELAALLISRRR